MKIAAGEEDDTRREERNFVEQIPVKLRVVPKFSSVKDIRASEARERASKFLRARKVNTESNTDNLVLICQ